MTRLRMPALSRLVLAGAAALAVVASALTPAATGARAEAADRPEYVALGDSYSAGVFVRPWDESDGCGRSYRNYPHQVAERFGYRLRDVTCGAAEVVDGILEPQPSDKILGPPTVPPEGAGPNCPPSWRRCPRTPTSSPSASAATPSASAPSWASASNSASPSP